MGRLSSYIRLSPFEFLRRVEPQQIYNFLQNEHPQTVALVLSLPRERVGGARACRCSARTAGRGRDAHRRDGPHRAGGIREVEQVMERKLSAVINQELATAGGVKSLVDILNFVDRDHRADDPRLARRARPELGEDVRKLMFVFEDLLLLDDRAIQQMLKEIEIKDVGLALKGAGEEVREKIFGNMSSRAAQMLLEDMEFMGPVRRRIIEEAQGRSCRSSAASRSRARSRSSAAAGHRRRARGLG